MFLYTGGGYSQVEMQYNLISSVLESVHKYKRIVNLTGTDYPIKSNTELLEEFCDLEKEYITGFKIEKNASKSNASKIVYYHRMDGNRILHYFFEAVKINREKMLKSFQYDFYFGSEYWALTYEAVKEIIEMWEENPKLQKFLRGVFVPSEIWIHTLFFSSQFREKGYVFQAKYKGLQELSPLTYFKYKDQIKILNDNDFDSILQSNKMFARKIVVGKSDALIESIDRQRKT